jgi:hypothetical protein
MATDHAMLVTLVDQIGPDRAAQLDLLAAAWLLVAHQARREALRAERRAGSFATERARQVAQLHALVSVVSEAQARDHRYVRTSASRR